MLARLLVVLGLAVALAGIGVSGPGLPWLASSSAPAVPEAPPEPDPFADGDLGAADVAEGGAAPDEGEAAGTRRDRVHVKRGENFVGALVRGGIPHRIGHEIAMALSRAGANLRRVRPQEAVEITWNLDGDPVSIQWEPSPWLGYVVISTEDGWTVERRETTPDVRLEAVHGRVERSLFDAIEAAREKPGLVMDLVSMFESEFDFTADTRPGDSFRLLVEKRYAGDLFVDYGRVLVAQYASGSRTLTGVGFESRGGRFGYYDLDGQSLRRSFLKSPLEYSRITSGFTYARPHPILGGTRPHLAVDYAAPVGTPVRAVADGTVLRAGWAGGNGISIMLRHRKGYETMYNHLSRVARGIRPGVRVKQRQVIGFVGSTGLSTGPHLDYRVRKNGVWVNPLGEKFLPGEPVAAAERTAFHRHARALVERLEREAPL